MYITETFHPSLLKHVFSKMFTNTDKLPEIAEKLNRYSSQLKNWIFTKPSKKIPMDTLQDLFTEIKFSDLSFIRKRKPFEDALANFQLESDHIDQAMTTILKGDCFKKFISNRCN
jgi:hypothetical protein